MNIIKEKHSVIFAKTKTMLKSTIFQWKECVGQSISNRRENSGKILIKKLGFN